MSTPLITAISAVTSPERMATLQPVLPGAMPVPTAAVDASGQFGHLVTQGIDKVNGDLVASQVDMQRLATGNATDLHRIMIHLEESQLSFQLMMQVRNRLLDAYQDVMKMQV